jgi:hydroxymethylglutaryl-CoA lyase
MIRVIEVGPRDGLQNEKTPISTELKLDFIAKLAHAGLKEIEATSFVSPKWVPQLGDAAELWPQLPEGPRYSALVPNVKGLERAISVGCHRVAVFTAASEAFTLRNINMTIQQSLDGFKDVVEGVRAAASQSFVRGYLSTAFECPFSGRVSVVDAARVAESLLELGVDEVSVGDTIGVASPREVRELTSALLSLAPASKWVYHFHDTRGTAIANTAAALELGIAAFDSAAAGLGGCPYAPGAGGNLATEDLVYFLHREGLETGINGEALAQASLEILKALGKPPVSRAQLASLAACASSQTQ